MSSSQGRHLINEIADRHHKELEAGNNLRRSLALHVQAWPDPAHALLEILQNADDAGPASGRRTVSVTFRFCKDGLIVEHDGQPFSDADVRGISSIGDATKSAEKHIGFMGIGFKSVYRFASASYIKSGSFSFCFRPTSRHGEDYGWIIVPAWCDDPPVRPSIPDGTLFYFPYLPFVDGDVREHLERALISHFPGVCLMFLRRVARLSVVLGDQEARTLSKRDNIVEDRMVVDGKEGDPAKTFFWPFRQRFAIPPECKSEFRVRDSGRHLARSRQLTVVFGTDADRREFHSIETASSFFAFLPTDQHTRLTFAVQGDFILDAQRSFIDQNLQWNRWLLQSAAEVLLAAVAEFKRHRTTKYCFFGVLPPPDMEAEEFIRRHFLEPFWDKCRRTKVVPSRRGRWLTPGQAIFAPRDVQALLDSTKLRQLTGRVGYVHPEVPKNSFLTGLGVDTFEEPDLIIQALEDVSWLRTKDVTWFKSLYKLLDLRLSPHGEEWWSWRQYKERLKQLPIVPTTDGTLAAPSDVLFPPKARREHQQLEGLPSVRLVNSKLAVRSSRRFLREELGVRAVDQEGIIRHSLLPQIESGAWRSWTTEQRERVLRLLLVWLRSRRWECPPDLRKGLALTPLPTANGGWCPAKDLYLRTDALRRLLGRAKWVAERPEPGWRRFVQVLGVPFYPRVDHDEERYDRSNPPKGAPRWNEYWWDTVDYTGSRHSIGDVAGLPLLETSLSASKTRTLAEVIAGGWSAYYKSFRSSRHFFFYYRSKSEPVDSYFLWQLKNTAWLPTTKGIRQPGPDVFVPTPEVKRAFGDLPAYLALPQNLLEKATDLWDLLGLTSGVTPKATASVLRSAAENRPSDRPSKQLGNVYKIVGRQVSRLAEDEAREALDEWRVELSVAPLLAENGRFVTERGEHVLWAEIDAKDVAELLAEAVTFIWYPQDMEQAVVASLFDVCQVGPLSGALTVHLHPSTIAAATLEPEMTSRMCSRLDVLYSCVSHRNPGVRQEARRVLERLQAYFRPTVNIVLRTGSIARSGDTRCFLDRGAARIYCASDCSDLDIALELCRAWNLGKDFAPTLESVLARPPQEAQARLEQLGIAQLSLGEPDESEGEPVGPSAGEAEPSEPPSQEGLEPQPWTEREASEEGMEPGRRTFPLDEDPARERADLPTEEEGIGGRTESADKFLEELPPLASLSIRTLDYVAGTGTMPAPSRPRVSAREAMPKTPREAEKQPRSPDLVGDRAEAIVNLYECTRLGDGGHDVEQRLSWVSEQDPQANHDFESVDEDGENMYIEVKAVGQTGSFRWTGNEIALAHEKRGQYWLYLVLDVTTVSPTIIRYRDPIGLWREGELELRFDLAMARAPIPGSLGSY